MKKLDTNLCCLQLLSHLTDFLVCSHKDTRSKTYTANQLYQLFRMANALKKSQNVMLAIVTAQIIAYGHYCFKAFSFLILND